jgi:hypothetical protein
MVRICYFAAGHTNVGQGPTTDRYPLADKTKARADPHMGNQRGPLTCEHLARRAGATSQQTRQRIYSYASKYSTAVLIFNPQSCPAGRAAGAGHWAPPAGMSRPAASHTMATHL